MLFLIWSFETLFAHLATFCTGSSKKRPSDTRKGLSDPKKRKKEMDDFSLMLEENVTDK